VTVAIPHPASVKPTLSTAWGVRHFITLRLPGAVARAQSNNFAIVDELVRRWSPEWTVPAGETDAVKEAFRAPGCLDAALGYYRAMRPWLPASLRTRITVPSVAFAVDDGLLGRDAYERARRWFTNRYDVSWVGGGHFVHRERPKEFIAELLRVLATA